MDDSASLEDSSMTIVQADSTIAFAYIKELQSKKKRFYVLKCQPRRPGSPSSEFDPTSRSASISLPPNFFLYAYKNKKYFERGDAKRVYDLTNVILLSRCTKKANKTILGVCFQDDALFLKFDTEDELSRWYFHLNEIFSTKRNCLWPELKQCFSVTLKNKELASAAARHGKANLPGQYRFCLTESAVLLVKDDLLNPVLSLPFPCIRSCVHSMTSNFFQIHLGRLSPIGEGVLHSLERLPRPTSGLQKAAGSAWCEHAINSAGDLIVLNRQTMMLEFYQNFESLSSLANPRTFDVSKCVKFAEGGSTRIYPVGSLGVLFVFKHDGHEEGDQPKHYSSYSVVLLINMEGHVLLRAEWPRAYVHLVTEEMLVYLQYLSTKPFSAAHACIFDFNMPVTKKSFWSRSGHGDGAQ